MNIDENITKMKMSQLKQPGGNTSLTFKKRLEISPLYQLLIAQYLIMYKISDLYKKGDYSSSHDQPASQRT